MSRVIEATGRTVDEAIFNGLQELSLSIDEVDIDIISEGSKGILGIAGRKAVVKLSERVEETVEEGHFLNGVLDRMGVKATLAITEDEESIHIKASGPNMGVLIGHRGETLDALQYLSSLVINKDREEYKRVVLDTENYRVKREETLARLARRLAGKAQKTGRKIELEPMNPYERRIMHATLQNHPSITTYSEGEDPNRYVVIDLKK
ncbi:MAG: RNA-binding cell elongation regulator Jag/EloR [Christensenellales bacterium]|jgi:spoIIIJ-associated protein